MKITKRQLRRIIKENRSQEILKLISDKISEVGFGDEDEEDFESVKIELEEDGLASQEELDQLTFESWKDLKESTQMKITKRQLRRIIKEEKQKILNEAHGDYPLVQRDEQDRAVWTVDYDDDRVFRVTIDEDNLSQEMEVELDPAKLAAALESGTFDKAVKKGPPAGSMPWSQSPANPKNR